MIIGVIIGCAIVAVLGIGVLAGGAPFLPTRKIWINDAMKLANINANDVIVDLGSGNGAVMKSALKCGAKRAIGYEINPFLVIWSRLKLWKFRGKYDVIAADFFKIEFPRDTTIIYIFQVDKVLKKIPELIADWHKKNPARKIRIIVFGFDIPNKKPARELNGMKLYEF